MRHIAPDSCCNNCGQPLRSHRTVYRELGTFSEDQILLCPKSVFAPGYDVDFLVAVEARNNEALHRAVMSEHGGIHVDTRLVSSLKDVPQLVAEIRKLRGQVSTLEQAVERRDSAALGPATPHTESRRHVSAPHFHIGPT